MVDTYHYTYIQPIENITGRVNPNGFWFIMMCANRPINFHKRITLVNDVDHEGVYACVGEGDIWETSVLLHDYETKTALKKS